jgi:hypothetical protein
MHSTNRRATVRRAHLERNAYVAESVMVIGSDIAPAEKNSTWTTFNGGP